MIRRGDPLSVLVIDDSAVMRQMMTVVLSREPGIHVHVASDPLIAMSKMERVRPDVIVLDLDLPKMDGMSFLRRIMASDPIPVVVCSGIMGPGTTTALRALQEGAVDVVVKPKLGLRDFLEESSKRFIDVIWSAAQARVRRHPPAAALRDPAGSSSCLPIVAPAPTGAPGAEVARPARPPACPRAARELVIAMGASTGGTGALQQILSAMPRDAPGMVIVQHMPEGFTAAFAALLDRQCRMDVAEAKSGDCVIAGRALIAPGNRHTRLLRSSAGYTVEILDGPPVSHHRPSVDVLFRSVASAAGPSALGVLLTGMGDDGAAGLLEMKNAGAWTIAQNEATCVVFGMSKEAIRLGGASEVVALPGIAAALLRAWR